MAYYLIGEILATFIFTYCLLHEYISFKKIPFFTSICVFICWFFSFLTIIVLPTDITNSFYDNCINNKNKSEIINNTSSSNETLPIKDEVECIKPFDYINNRTLSYVWAIVYWTNFLLTCFVLRVLSSFSCSGQFTLAKKIKEFLKYTYFQLRIYVVLGCFLLGYLVYTFKIKITEFNSLRALISSLNNFYSLLNLTFLLGIGIVKIPRFFRNNSDYSRKLDYFLFKIGKQNEKLALIEIKFEDCLDEIKKVYELLKNNDGKLKKYFNILLEETPLDFQKKIDQRIIYSENTFEIIDEDKLVEVHSKFKNILNQKLRLESSIKELVDQAIDLEEIIRNEKEPTKKFISHNNHYKSEKYLTTLFKKYFFLPKLEWYWKCFFIKKFNFYFSFILIILSVFLFTSELFYSLNFKNYAPIYLGSSLINYLNLNLILKFYIIFLLLYISISAYHTLFTLNLFGYFKLASNKQTDEYNLIFCTRYICCLSPGIALNMFNLIGIDYLKKDISNPSYIKIMGQLQFLNKFSDFLFYLLPAILCLLSFFTFFNLTDKILHYLGYERFVVKDDITQTLIAEGIEHLEKEKKNRIRKSNLSKTKNEFLNSTKVLDTPSSNNTTFSSNDTSTASMRIPKKNLFDEI